MSDAVLELDRVTVRRDGRAVLEDVSLRVERGTVHAIVGPNGAGKSTLLAAALGQTAFTGSIVRRFQGAGAMGFVPQAFATDRTLPVTVAELLALTRQRWPVCLGVRVAARARIAAALNRVGLAGFEARRLGELSGGELRRVLLANALEPTPELLILDEPATGMDRASQRRLDDILAAAAHDDGAAVLVVSHDLDQVKRLADHVTWLERTVRRSGTPAEVLDAAEELADG